MSAIELLHPKSKSRDDFRTAVVLGAGSVLAGGALWWALQRSRRDRRRAPGWPGATPHWNFSSKDGVGTAIGPRGRSGRRVWFTIRDGAFAELFYPRADLPAVRDLGLIVTGAGGFFSDLLRDADHQTSWLADGVPAFHLIDTCCQGHYQIEKTVFAHPRRDAVLQVTRFHCPAGRPADYRLFILLTPHLGNRGGNNTAWIGQHKGTPMLWAERNGHSLAVACSTPWIRCSAGFVGSASDGRRELVRHGRLVHAYDRAENGNVILTGEVDLAASDGQFLLAVGFGASPAEAAHCARASLLDDVEVLTAEYIRNWLEWQQSLTSIDQPAGEGRDLYRTSAAILRAHEDQTGLGAAVASLSIPWGQARTDAKTGVAGYHVVWPRDLVEIAGGLLAAGARDDAVGALSYLQATQHSDGRWAQNQWVDGTQEWNSNQMGETGLPLLLLDQLMRQGALGSDELRRYWPMVRAAACYILRCGPSTPEDRWEDAHGFAPFTISVLISALLVAADMAERHDEPAVASYLRETADAWNDKIDSWTYVEGTELARQAGVPGYYLRIAPPDHHGEPRKYAGGAELWYRQSDAKPLCTSEVVSPDALAYVRFGLRAPDDPRIVNTVKVIDAVLKAETPRGPVWHRYTADGYGEKKDGSPFDGKHGIGRGWPLLTGERAHYELSAGRRDRAVRLLRAFEMFASDSGMIPEQVWDAADIPGKGLFLGRPSGSAMPLAWAHAEYIKLRRSLADGRVFDTPAQTVERYLVEKVRSRVSIWRDDYRCGSIARGCVLRIESLGLALVRFNTDGGSTLCESRMRDTGLGVHFVDLPTANLPSGREIRFTLVPIAGASWGKTIMGSINPHLVRVE